jgi:hypothetical protein
MTPIATANAVNALRTTRVDTLCTIRPRNVIAPPSSPTGSYPEFGVATRFVHPEDA